MTNCRNIFQYSIDDLKTEAKSVLLTHKYINDHFPGLVHELKKKRMAELDYLMGRKSFIIIREITLTMV